MQDEPSKLDISDEMIAERRGGSEKMPEDMPSWMAKSIIKIDKFSKRHQFKPGITGLAQVQGFRGKIRTFYDMSSRVKLDRYYFKNWSIFYDFKICFKTFFGILLSGFYK